MGLLRLGVIAAIGIALLPSDSEQQEMLYNRAALAARWTVTFCDRNGPTCAQASETWAAFARKAEFAGKLAYDMISEQVSGDGAGGKPAAAPAKYSSTAKSPRGLETGTLKPADLQPRWRGDGTGVKPAARL